MLVVSGVLAALTAAAICSPFQVHPDRDSDPRGRERRSDPAPRAGQPAPDIELPRLDAEGRFRLSDQLRQRPTVLVFGSYT